MDILRLKPFAIFSLLASMLIGCQSHANELRIAVSQSFVKPLEKVCLSFEKVTHHHCNITTTSTGHLYAQGMHSNLFDVFIGSNPYYTNGLIHAGKAEAKNHYLLALSRLVLWSSDPNLSREAIYRLLMHDNKITIVIPDPKIANYGMATKETLQNLDIWANVQKRLIYATSIRQAYELLKANPAYIGFVSLSHLPPEMRQKRQYWEPDSSLHEPVIHDLVAMSSANNQEVQNQFIEFITSTEVCPIFEQEGYICKLNRL